MICSNLDQNSEQSMSNILLNTILEQLDSLASLSTSSLSAGASLVRSLKYLYNGLPDLWIFYGWNLDVYQTGMLVYVRVPTVPGKPGIQKERPPGPEKTRNLKKKNPGKTSIWGDKWIELS